MHDKSYFIDIQVLPISHLLVILKQLPFYMQGSIIAGISSIRSLPVIKHKLSRRYNINIY